MGVRGGQMERVCGCKGVYGCKGRGYETDGEGLWV